MISSIICVIAFVSLTLIVSFEKFKGKKKKTTVKMHRGSHGVNNKQVSTLKSDMSPKDGSNSGSSDIETTCCSETLGNPKPTTMNSLAIVNPTVIDEITTTTITTQSTSVSTHGNLIEKMLINDVSSKIMIYSPITATFENLPVLGAAAAANHEIVADFSGHEEEKNDDNTSTADASNMTNTITAVTTLLESAAGKELTSIGAVRKLTTTTTTTNELLTAMKCATHGQQQQRMATIISEMKSKSTENKCPQKELATVSYQRELEANSTKKAAATYLNWNIVENLDIILYEGLAAAPIKDRNQQLTLAARNAKLKLEFLENSQRSPLTKVLLPKLKTEASSQTAKVINNTNLTLGGGLHNRKATNLKLRIPERGVSKSTTASSSSTTRAVLECPSPKLSLVAQRKADLNRRFQQQSAIKTSSGGKSSSSSKTSCFPSVAQLKLKYDRRTRLSSSMIVPNPNQLTDIASPGTQLLKPAVDTTAMEQRHSPLSDEGCNLGQSPYSSDDNEDNVSIRTTSTILERKRKDKVARSASSDSALGLEVDDPMSETAAVPPPAQQQQQRRMTLTVTDLPLRPALLPLAEPTALPDSPTTDPQQTIAQTIVVPSKVLLEERVVEIPEDPRYIGGCCSSLSSSRRESAQSCISDYPNSECSGVRFVRTPSVVVSDYSDDVGMCGITLEEIEYFRAQRMRRRSSLDTSGTEKDADGGAHSDVSASSSCSNLYYCGSTISALDGAECYVNGIRMSLPERKASDCSTCSGASGGEEEDAFTIPEQPEDTTTTNVGQMDKDLADLLAAQHLSTKRPKKLVVANGMLYAVGGLEKQTIERYDHETNQWSMICRFIAETCNDICTTFNGNVIALYYDYVDQYNSATNECQENTLITGLSNVKHTFSFSGSLQDSKFFEN